MTTDKIYSIKIGIDTRRGGFNVYHEFVARFNNNESQIEVYNYYTKQYKGLVVKILEIPVSSIESPVMPTTQTKQSGVTVRKRSFNAYKYKSDINGDLYTELQQIGKAYDALKISFNDIHSRVREYLKDKYGEIAKDVKLNNFTMDSSYIEYKVIMDGEFVSELESVKPCPSEENNKQHQ